MSQVTAASIEAYGEEAGSLRVAHRGETARVSDGSWKGLSRERREELEESFLASGATRARGAGTRAEAEAPDPLRTCFERDLDRIKYSRAFRRLVGKCQVFVAPDDVHMRNRMTHAIEVAQVATSIARATGLNVALCEAMALGHDCGHGPGGHASEDAFAPYVEGGYDHALWGADVTLAGLNLCVETLDGIRQHSWRLAAPTTPEGLVLSWADRIAYLCHDLDDAVRAGILQASELPVSVRELAGTRQSSQIRTFTNSIITAIEATGRVGMPAEYADALEDYRRFNYERIYLRPAAQQQGERVIALLSGLVEFYAQAPGRLPDVASGEIPFPTAGSKDALLASVSYVSGMTDRFAMAQAVALLGWRSEALPRSV